MKQLIFLRLPWAVGLAILVGLPLFIPSLSSAQGLDGGQYYGPPSGEGEGPQYDEGRRHRRGPRHRQGPQMSPEERVQQRLSRMTQELSLSPNQVRRIRGILTRTQAQMQDMRPARPEDRGQQRNPEDRDRRRAFREQRRQLRWATQDRIQAVLTCEQRETLRRARREMRHSRRGEGGRADRGRRGRRRGGHGRSPGEQRPRGR